MSVKLAELYHDTLQRLAPSFGVKVAKDWDKLSDQERALLVAAADIVELRHFANEPNADGGSENVFTTSAGYGFLTQTAFVAIEYNGLKLAQMLPEQAADLAAGLMLSAQLAIGDSFLIEFLRDEVAFTEDEMAGMLHSYRHWRDHRQEHSLRGEDHRHAHESNGQA